MKIDYLKGYELIVNNYKSLRSAAKHLYQVNNFGLASSLNVLSAEELVKSIFVFIKLHNEDVELKNFDKIFRHHKTKHSELETLIKYSYNGIENLTFNILEGKEEFIESLLEDKKEEFRKENIDIERVKKRTEKIKKFKIPVEEIIDWLNTSNDIKNNGLYVDLKRDTGVWKSPSDFKKDTAEKELCYTKVLNLCFQNFMDIYIFMNELRLRSN